MARPLVFQYGENQFTFAMNKVDRAKLYGFKEVMALDEQGEPCELATLADDGQTLLGRGGAGFAYLSPDGLWCDKSDLTPVNLDGEPIESVASSFSAPVPLDQRVGVDDYLLHNVRSLYVLTSEDDTEALAAELKEGAIFKFPYSYRGGLEADAGFMLMGEDGNVFLAVGSPADIHYVGLMESASVVEEESDEEEDEDLMDFDMI